MQTKRLATPYAIILYSFFSVAFVTFPARAFAQAAPPAAPAPATAAPAEPAVPTMVVIGEQYHAEVQVGAWFSMPSTMMYSDTESVTSGTTTTTVNGTNIDFKKDLGLANKVFPEVHLTIRLAPKHKLRGDFMPIYYKQSATLASDIAFDGQNYLKGQSVESTLRWNEWKAGYEFDVISEDRYYVGAIFAGSSLNLSGAMANSAQSGTASVNILMPGLGATARYYVAPKFSVTGEFLYFYLPGSATSTHGHVMQVDGYATFNFTKHAGVQAGFRSFDTAHVWGSPLNTGSMTIFGPYVGGTAHF